MCSRRSSLSGIDSSNPTRSLFTISRKNTPDLLQGSKNFLVGSFQIDSGSKSNTRLAMIGGVKISSELKLAKASKISGFRLNSMRLSVIVGQSHSIVSLQFQQLEQVSLLLTAPSATNHLNETVFAST